MAPGSEVQGPIAGQARGMVSCETIPTAPPVVAARVRFAAHAVPFMTLPSALWRFALLLGLPVMSGVTIRPWEYPYIFSLSLVTEGLALLTLGLIQPWGETFPRWVPWFAGGRVPARVVVVAAGLGSVALTVIWGFAFRNAFDPSFLGGFGGPVQRAVVIVCYAPLLLWGPTLAYVTVAYRRRRRLLG